MTYNSMYNFCNNNQIDGAQVYIAYEMHYQLWDRLEIGAIDERFEQLCFLAYELYLKAEDITMTAICIEIADLEFDFRQEEGKDPMTMSIWDILGKINHY